MQTPTLTPEERAVCLGEVGIGFETALQERSQGLSIPALEADYRRTRSQIALIAWSDAVGAESRRLGAALQEFRGHRKDYELDRLPAEARANRGQVGMAGHSPG